jgi:hypothetical protein
MDDLDLIRLRATADPYYLAKKNRTKNREYARGTYEERKARMHQFESLLNDANRLYQALCGKPDDYSLPIEERCKATIQLNEVRAIMIDLARKISYADPDIDLDMERLKAGERESPNLHVGPRGGVYEWTMGKSGIYKKYR